MALDLAQLNSVVGSIKTLSIGLRRLHPRSVAELLYDFGWFLLDCSCSSRVWKSPMDSCSIVLATVLLLWATTVFYFCASVGRLKTLTTQRVPATYSTPNTATCSMHRIRLHGDRPNLTQTFPRHSRTCFFSC